METALPLIIRHPALQSFTQQTTGYGILLLGWGFFLALLQPLLIFIGWVVAGFLFQNTILVGSTRGWDNFYANFISFYGIIIFFIWLTFFLWFLYNYTRYGGSRDFRTSFTHTTVVTAKDYAQQTGFLAKDIDALQSAKLAIFHFDEIGEIKKIHYITTSIDVYLTAEIESRNQLLATVGGNKNSLSSCNNLQDKTPYRYAFELP